MYKANKWLNKCSIYTPRCSRRWWCQTLGEPNMSSRVWVFLKKNFCCSFFTVLDEDNTITMCKMFYKGSEKSLRVCRAIEYQIFHFCPLHLSRSDPQDSYELHGMKSFWNTKMGNYWLSCCFRPLEAGNPWQVISLGWEKTGSASLQTTSLVTMVQMWPGSLES